MSAQTDDKQEDRMNTQDPALTARSNASITIYVEEDRPPHVRAVYVAMGRINASVETGREHHRTHMTLNGSRMALLRVLDELRDAIACAAPEPTEEARSA